MEFNPYSRKLHADPFPAYARLREEHPLYFNERFRFWTLSRHEDVLNALKDWQTFSSASGITLQSFSGFKPMIILMDPPRQTELRAILLKALTPRRVARLEDRIRRIARELVGELLALDTCDFVRSFAAPYPTTVIAELLGVEAGDRGRFKAWSDAIMTAPHTAADSLRDTYDRIFDYFTHAIAQRREDPRDDLLSALVAAESEGQRLDHDELLGFCALLLIAGNETMANFLGNAMLALDRNPEARRMLARDPALFPTAVDELLRFEPPVHELARTLTRDFTLHGRTLRAGDRVLLLLAAANRDPEVFAEPEVLDLARQPNPHLGFGFGVHFCMGASLARLEARIALEELLRAIPDYRVTDSEIRWFRTPAVRGPAALPIAYGARSRARGADS